MPGAWEENNQSVLIAILNGREVVHTKWALALRNLQVPLQNQIITPKGLPFDHARNDAVRHALSHNFTWLFFLDDDVVAPYDGLARLLNHKLDIVSGLYFRRSPPLNLPVMMRNEPAKNEKGELVKNEKGEQVLVANWVSKFDAPALLQVDYVGAGCLLIHRRALEKTMEATQGRPFRWLSEVGGPDGRKLSEDYAWCDTAQKCGFKIMVDTGIQCGHIGSAEASINGFGAVDY